MSVLYIFEPNSRLFLKLWQERLALETTHPHTGQKVSYYRCFELQIREYIGCLMGERDTYRPMRLPEKW